MVRLRNAESLALLLDFDGTLARIRSRPGNVLLSESAKAILRRLLFKKRLFVAVVSGRDLRTLKTLVGVRGIPCVGLHGAERQGISTILSNRARRDLSRALQDVRFDLRALPGIWIEEKGLSFAVHYRGARRSKVQAADLILRRALAPLRNTLRILDGDKVWEIMPREIPGKGAAVRELLQGLPRSTVTIYFGDDQTDEEAFAVLRGQITVKVGSARSTRARFYLRNPSEVVQCLARLEKELP